MPDDDSDLTIQMTRVGFEEPGKRGFFLKNAAQAEEQAAHAPDPATKQKWLKIAEGYRSLAIPTAKSKQ
jgi:hypothetical protein